VAIKNCQKLLNVFANDYSGIAVDVKIAPERAVSGQRF